MRMDTAWKCNGRAVRAGCAARIDCLISCHCFLHKIANCAKVAPGGGLIREDGGYDVAGRRSCKSEKLARGLMFVCINQVRFDRAIFGVQDIRFVI